MSETVIDQTDDERLTYEAYSSTKQAFDGHRSRSIG
jgi:hypothetical protein